MSVIDDLAVSVVIGSLAGAGGSLLLGRFPGLAVRSLGARIDPYVRDIGDPLGLTPVLRATPSRDRLRLLTALGRLGDGDALHRRIAQAGWSMTAASFRARQLGAAVAGMMLGAVVAVVGSLSGFVTTGGFALAPLAAVTGIVACDVALQRAGARRRARIEDELPTVLEFLSLCLAAGEGMRDALRRVGEAGTGELTAELRRAVLASGTGSSLSDALTATARRLDVASLTRATDHIVSAIDRGAPLALVLQHQATDVREEAKRRLIEAAGRKEIAMLLPLVFLLLPLSVLYALFPGVVMLRLGIG